MRDFTNPFRYIPEPSVEHAARLLMRRIESSEVLSGFFSEGKMLGVLVVRDRSGKEFFISGFSGNAAGQSIIDGFVPPIYDLCYPDNTSVKIYRAKSKTFEAGYPVSLYKSSLKYCQ